MSRVINPDQYNTKEFFNNLPIVEHNGEKFRKWVKDESYTLDGKYQCYKDCDCYSQKGKRVIKIRTVYRNVLFDNTGKAFYEDINYKPIQYVKP